MEKLILSMLSLEDKVEEKRAEIRAIRKELKSIKIQIKQQASNHE